MESGKSYSRGIDIISAIFGVNFTTNFKVGFLISLQAVFVLFSCCFFSFVDAKNHIYLMIVVIQTVVPLIAQVVVNIEAFLKRSTEVQITNGFEKLQSELFTGSAENISKQLTCARTRFFLKLSILLVIRAIKIWFSPRFSLNTMMPELIGSVNFYLFTFYIDWLTAIVRSYARNVTPRNVVQLKLKQHYSTFYRQGHFLMQRFRISLLLASTINFVMLIISFYYIFLRIVYGPMM